MDKPGQRATEYVPTYCYQCVAGPDLLQVKVENGVATEVTPNFDAEDIHPAAGRVCVKAFGLIQKTYNPHRIKTPMKRTNPKKGKDEDPGFVPITWDEALDLITEKLSTIQQNGLTDENGHPRLAASFGGGGTPTAYMGTFPAFLSAWGVADFGLGSGQGVKCYHSEHLYGELWHRAFTVCADTPRCDYILSFGYNAEASSGVCGVKRHADARGRGAKRIQLEPHLSVTGACSSEWLAIKPKTDAAFLYSMLYVLLHEIPRGELDLDFISNRTTSPYLVGPNGYYMREPKSGKPLVFDTAKNKPVAFDTPGSVPALEGEFKISGHEEGPDDIIWKHTQVACRTAFSLLVEAMCHYSPSWAAEVCGIPAVKIREVALDFLKHARIGETIEIEGRTLPLRPVAIALGKTVNNGWGGFDCCWARTLLACLIGGLEVPGGTLGTTVRLNRPATSRQASVTPSRDGIMDYPMNATRKENWVATPDVRNANRTLVPLVANSPWSQALGPTHLAWMMQKDAFDPWPKAKPPDVWFVYRTNPAISFWDTDALSDSMAKFPFTVCFALTRDETNHMADILLPECTDLEGLQLLRIGNSKYTEQFWRHSGFALRQPAATTQGEARDFTWIATQLAARTGLLERYNTAINRGAAGIVLTGENYDFSLAPDTAHDVDDIWDACCKAASAELSDGENTDGLDYYRTHGFKTIESPELDWYLYPVIEDLNLRFEMPYQERLKRVGGELSNRLHEQGITWWDNQLEEYEPLPAWHDYPGLWESALEKNFDIDIADFPFWLVTSRSMQYAWGGNAGIQMIREVAQNIAGHDGVIMNAARGHELGFSEGDLVEVSSPLNLAKGRVVLRNGIRPDTLLMIGQFGHWATPLAKGFDVPSMNALVPMLLDLTDSTGSGCDLVKVNIRKLAGPS